MRVSCTTLESFRIYMSTKNDWMTEADLVASIKRETPDSPAMALGRAFESVLMAPERYKTDGAYSCGGYVFNDKAMDFSIALVDRRGVFQVKATKSYDNVDVVAVADLIVGTTIYEWKTTASSFNVDKYLESCQHRFMADIFQPSRITYHVFCLGERDGEITLKGIETFTLYPYPELHADCCEMVRRFAEYVTAKGLDVLLNERQRAATEAA